MSVIWSKHVFLTQEISPLIHELKAYVTTSDLNLSLISDVTITATAHIYHFLLVNNSFLTRVGAALRVIVVILPSEFRSGPFVTNRVFSMLVELPHGWWRYLLIDYLILNRTWTTETSTKYECAMDKGNRPTLPHMQRETPRVHSPDDSTFLRKMTSLPPFWQYDVIS